MFPNTITKLSTLLLVISSLSRLSQQDNFAESCAREHNAKRRMHHDVQLQLDDKLTEHAESRASDMASSDDFSHKSGSGYGENLAADYAPSRPSCGKIVDRWYKESEKIDCKSVSLSYFNVGHYSQVVWKSTTRVGCAQASSKNKMATYTVCNYDPPGNMLGQFETNVPCKNGGAKLDLGFACVLIASAMKAIF
ncbi:Repressed by EFG1 protein 1 [Halotydeus destructor]|nr:Repressed by EFG1 protein 1 [Halotydeus destructor]